MSWITHSRKGDRYAYCKVCNTDLSYSEGGSKDIKRHGGTESRPTNAPQGLEQGINCCHAGC